MNRKPLRLLLVETPDDDARRMLEALMRYDFVVESTQVLTTADFKAALGSARYDVILSDYLMPDYDVLKALEILEKGGHDIPLIIVSEAMGEAIAVEAMRKGAVDHVPKGNLTRLGAVVERELRDAEFRRQQRLTDSFSHGQTEVLEMILNRMPVTEILEKVVLRVEALSPGEVIAGIMLADADRTHLKLAAGPRLPSCISEKLDFVPIEEGYGTCGTAAALRRIDIVEDVTTDPAWESVREVVLGIGIRSCWSVPVFSSDQRVIGTLSVYRSFPHVPTPTELHWVESATRLVSLAIERGQSSEKLRQSEELLRIASETAVIGGWAVDFPGGRVTWSERVRAIHEVSEDFVPNVEKGMEFYAPEWRDRIHEAFDRCVREGVPFSEELEIITASGKRVWVRSTGKALRDRRGNVGRVQGAMQDITLHKRAEMAEEAKQSNELRYLSQRNALISLNAGITSERPDLLTAFRRITETSARTLEVARVTLWHYNQDKTMIVCLDEFTLESGTHSSGTTLVAEEYRNYFEILSRTELIAAEDACEDPATREFAINYLIPNRITSTMDLPIRFGKCISYFICNEHLGPARHWTSDEKTFAIAVANHVSLALESHEKSQAQTEVLKSHQRFQSVAAATNDTIWDWNLETDAFWWYDGFASLYGRPADGPDVSVQHWRRQIHPEDRDRVVESIQLAIANGESDWSAEYRFVSVKGKVAHVRDRGRILRDPQDRPIRMVGGMTDLTEAKLAELRLARSHRALQMLSSCNEMLVRISSEAELLAEACRLAVNMGGYHMAWIGYAGDDRDKRVVPMAHAGNELGYLSEVEIVWAENVPSGRGPVGRAIRSGKAVVIEDLMEDPSFGCWVPMARVRGFRSIICLPLINGIRTFGVLCLYGIEVHRAGADEMKMLHEMSADIAFGIDNIRSRVKHQRAQDVVLKVAQAVSSGVGSEFFDLLTRNMVESVNAHGGLIGRFDKATNSIGTISFYMEGRRMENLSYSLDGTPCEDVAGGEICMFEDGVQQRFPNDKVLIESGIESYVGIPLKLRDGVVVGIMLVLFQSALSEGPLVESTLRIFAARAASELEREKSDARIREQASLLDKARDAIVVRDLEHRITYWNQSAERIYGWRAEEVMGRQVHEIIYQNQADYLAAHQQTLRQGEWTGETLQADKSGREMIIEGRWTLVCDDRGRPESVFALNTDISEQRKLEQQFIRAQRMESLGTLAGGIAHDLNNILAPLSMSTELLLMRVTDGRARELLETIASSARRGTEMVGQVLSFARGVEGQRVEIHPLAIIREIENILRGTILRGIELTVEADRELWIVRGDPTQIHQVILNLCVNARDAIEAGGEVAILASNVEIDASFAGMNLEASEGPHVCIEVRDSGMGIPAGVIDRIFDPFFTTKSVGKGTGLGLSTSLAIVRSHGGFIRVVSHPGDGSRFKVYLPAYPESGARKPAVEGPSLPRGKGEMILVVDDEQAIRETTSLMLESFGYQVLVAANGDEAIGIFKSRPSGIQGVITDMMMPGMDGRGTMDRLREIDPKVRIIATSGVPSNRHLMDDSQQETQEFLHKPYTSETLLTSLRQLLDGGRSDLKGS